MAAVLVLMLPAAAQSPVEQQFLDAVKNSDKVEEVEAYLRAFPGGWEWVEDCRVDGYDAAPADGSALQAAACERRVLRGGSWGDRVQLVRAANRRGTEPTVRNGVIGFRVVRED